MLGVVLMAMRAMWKGIITFGEMRIPVKLYAAVRDTRIDFDLLHDADLAPLRQEMVCTVEQLPVPAEHRVKGLEVEPGEYVVVTTDELDALQPEGSRDIEVREFVPTAELDLRYIERTYYLGPDEDSRRYATLLAALADAGKAGICQWVMRKRSYLGALQVREGLLIISTLRYANEVVDAGSFEIPSAVVSDRERELAMYLIDALTGDFNPAQYEPEYPQRVRELIEQKAAGLPVEIAPPVEPEETSGDQLLQALQASLKEAKKRHAA